MWEKGAADPPAPAAIILAAGKGERMKSDRAKVLFEVGGRPMLEHVLRAAQEAGCGRIVVIVGHQKEEVIACLPPGVEHAVQEKQLGTGHAAGCAKALLAPHKGEIVVLCGDVPLLRPQTIRRLVEHLRRTGAAVVVLSAKVRGEHAYGRIVRDAEGRFVRIVEHRDANAEERRIEEINTGIYAFAPGQLFRALTEVGNDNAAGEYYLTDAIDVLRAHGEAVRAIPTDMAEAHGVNSLEELRQVEAQWRSEHPAEEPQA